MKQMTLSRDIVRDLLPAFFSGTASPETMKLVEAFLKEDPEFLDAVDTHADRSLHQNGKGGHGELIALERARRLIRNKGIFMGFAIFFSLFPFSFSVSNGHFRWLMGGGPIAQAIFLLMAAGFWAGYMVTRRRLKITGIA